MILQKVSPLDIFFQKSETAKTEPQRRNETKHPNSMTTTRGLGRKSKLPEAGLEHREILPPHPAKTAGTRVE